MEEQARGHTADFSFHGRADYSRQEPSANWREKDHESEYSLIHTVVPHFVEGLEKFEYRSNGG